MSSRPSWASQSTSNQPANGDPVPSRSTDQSGRLSDSGTGTAMWLGTMSTTRPSPAARNRAAMARNAASPPRSCDTREWSTTSYPCLEPGVAWRIGDRYTWVTPRSAR